MVNGGDSRDLLRIIRRPTQRASRELGVSGGAEDTAVVEAMTAGEEKKMVAGIRRGGGRGGGMEAEFAKGGGSWMKRVGCA